MKTLAELKSCQGCNRIEMHKVRYAPLLILMNRGSSPARSIPPLYALSTRLIPSWVTTVLALGGETDHVFSPISPMPAITAPARDATLYRVSIHLLSRIGGFQMTSP